MSPYDMHKLLSSPRGEDTQSAQTTSRSTHDYALLEEYCFVRREAQAEADLAYQDWHAHACSERYAVYRAAQDRADAAQDDLASWSKRVAV
jgi:hypothetical protein